MKCLHDLLGKCNYLRQKSPGKWSSDITATVKELARSALWNQSDAGVKLYQFNTGMFSPKQRKQTSYKMWTHHMVSTRSIWKEIELVVAGANYISFRRINWGMLLAIITGRELRSGLKCIVLIIVTGSLWLVWRYRWNCIEIHLASTIPSH